MIELVFAFLILGITFAMLKWAAMVLILGLAVTVPSAASLVAMEWIRTRADRQQRNTQDRRKTNRTWQG